MSPSETCQGFLCLSAEMLEGGEWMPPLQPGAQEAPSPFYLKFKITTRRIHIPLCLCEAAVFA